MLNKRLFELTVILLAAVFMSVNLPAGDSAVPEAAPAMECAQAQSCSDSCCWENNLYNMGRGLVNILTCWLEVPRCLIYHNSQVPVMGLVVGACQGVGLTGMRAFAGVADVASFGFMTDSIYKSYHDFGEWVWNSRWVPKN